MKQLMRKEDSIENTTRSYISEVLEEERGKSK